jgi:hypothetical protein
MSEQNLDQMDTQVSELVTEELVTVQIEEPLLVQIEEQPEEPVTVQTAEQVTEELVQEQTEEEQITIQEEEEPLVVNEEELVQEQTEEPLEYVESEPDVNFVEIYQDSSSDENIIMEMNTIQIVPSINEVPSIVFIVPYRDRESHHKIFSEAMKHALPESSSHKIFYVHQTDSRGFNRGAMKNIGFLAVKNMYPVEYRDITLVFNDIDTMPSKDIALDYKTSRGVIKHFYGFDYTLGGIVSILAGDFERLNGFPNFWTWGYEDNLLQIRAKNMGIVIDRSVFYKIHDPRIVHLTDTPIRMVNRTEFDRYLTYTKEGIDSIKDLKYEIKNDTGFIDVLSFNTTTEEMTEITKDYDLRNGPAPFKDSTPLIKRRNPTMKMHF